MPYSSEWVDPEAYITHNDVTIYHTYDDDDVQAGVMSFWYTTDRHASVSDLSSAVFDVRELAGWTPGCDHAVIITAAIDRGDLTNKETS